MVCKIALILCATAIIIGLPTTAARALDNRPPEQQPSLGFGGGTETGVVGFEKPASLDLMFAGTPNPTQMRFGAGNAISFCPALSCINSPGDSPAKMSSFYDHQRASLLLSTSTQDDSHSEEQTLAVTTTIGTGYQRPYAAGAPYSRGDNVIIGNAVYRAVVAGTTGFNSAPPRTRPTVAQGGKAQFADGSVRWQWINDAAIAAKVGSYFETTVVNGAGAAWGAAFNYHFAATPQTGMFLPGIEMDYANDSGQPCAVGVTDCTALRLAMSGSQVTEGLQITGNDRGSSNYSSDWALRVNGDMVASQAAIEVDAASPKGLSFGGSGIGGQSHSVATIEDKTTSPATLSIGGKHNIAAIFDNSISQNGISLNGTYAGAQIVGKGFLVDPAGKVVGSGFRAALSTPASSSAPCKAGDFMDDVNYHYVCVTTNKWKRAALSAF